MDYNSSDLKKALKKLNLKNGDNIFCHSNLGFFGKANKINNSRSLCKLFFDTIMSIIGAKGTLIVPTFTYSFFKKKNFHYNSPSDTGIFSEYIRNLKDSLRSSDPNFSVTAIGKNKIFFTDTTTNNTYGKNSFFDKFHKLNGKILDLNFLGSTIIHYYERKLNVNYRFDKKFHGKINGERSTYVIFSRYLKNKTIHDPIPITEILRKKIFFFKSKLGKGEMTCITSRNFYNTIKKELLKDSNILIENNKYEK